MKTGKEQLTIAPELAAEFLSHVKRYEECGLDVDEDLDRYAKRNRGQLRRLGIRYPRKSSVQTRWLALRKAFAENKLQGLLEQVRADVEELHMGHAPLSEPDPKPDELEKIVAAEEKVNPELAPLAAQVREMIQELRESILDLR